MDTSRDMLDIINVIENGVDIALAGHTSPDGDAIGACFALAICLSKIGKRPLVLLEDYSEKYRVIPGNRFVYRGNMDELGTEARPVDTFIALDCACAERLGGTQALMEKTAETVCIDHHMDTDVFAKHNLLDCGASSTCEMVFELINQLAAIDQDVAAALYAGLVFDTGGFRHDCTTPETLQIAAKLMALGIPFSEIYAEVMVARSMSEVKALGAALQNLRMDSGYPIACLHLTLEELKRTGADLRDLDGIVEFGLNVREAQASVFVYERGGGELKVGLRSKGADVCGVARRFGGGGHRQAAACVFRGEPDEAFGAVLPLIRKALEEHG